MSKSSTEDKVFDSVAELFGVLSTPIRLKIINAVCHGEKNVSELLSIIDTTRDELQWEPFLRQCVPALAELEASRALLVAELEALSERVEGAKKLQTRLRALHGELS